MLLEEGGGLAPDDAVDQDAFNLELPLVLFEVVYHEVESSVKREVEELLLYFVFGQRDVVELLEVRHFQLHERFAQLAHEFGRGHIAFQFLEYLQLVLELLLGEVAVVEDITHELFAAHLAFPLEILEQPLITLRNESLEVLHLLDDQLAAFKNVQLGLFKLVGIFLLGALVLVD